MPIVTPKVEDKWELYDKLALRVFKKAIELLGGPRHIIQHRNLTWLPSLMEASYVWILYTLGRKTHKDIAAELGLTPQTVKKILSADVESVKKKIELGEKVDVHVAGGIARWAWEEVQREGSYTPDEWDLMESVGSAIAPWTVVVLKAIRGLNFPVERPELEGRLLPLGKIENVPVSEILDKLNYPISTPAELIKGIKEVLQGER